MIPFLVGVAEKFPHDTDTIYPAWLNVYIAMEKQHFQSVNL